MIVVTGANGFIGSRVVDALSVSGHRVRACVRSTATRDERCRGEWVEVGDVGASTDWSRALYGASTVIHAAAITSAGRPIKGGIDKLYDVNVGGALRLAAYAASMGVKRLVFLSSVKVNGETTRGRPFHVDDPAFPEDAYGRSKLLAERGLRLIADRSGLELVIVRPPMVYGPGVKGNFASLISLVRRGIPLPLASATENKRSMIALDNLSSALLMCATHPAAADRTFLVKDEEDLSTVGLLSQIARALDMPLRLFKVPERVIRGGASLLRRKGLVDRVFGDLQVDDCCIRSVLGWRPVITMDDAIVAACLNSSRSSS